MTNWVGITCYPSATNIEGKTVEQNRANALLRYFTWRIAVVVRMKRRRYAIGKVKM